MLQFAVTSAPYLTAMAAHQTSRKRLRRAAWFILAVVVVLGALRAALPYLVKDYVNRKLDEIPEYEGTIGDVDIHLWRGAYTIHDIRILKSTGQVPVPFFEADTMDLSIQWSQLFRGAIVGEIQLQKPRLTFVTGPTEEQRQTGIDKGWGKTLEQLFPFTINRFEIDEGAIRFHDPHSDPEVDIFVYDLFATAINLSNVRKNSGGLPASVRARGKAWGDGELEVVLDLDPIAKAPAFHLAAALTNVNLVALNDFMRAYGKVDVESGIFSVYTEIAGSDGMFSGYVKPFFRELNIYEWDQDRKEGVLKAFWEAIVGTVAAIFENQPKDQLATKIPVSGSFQNTDVDIWATLGTLLRNAFIRALLPRFERTVGFEQAGELSETYPSRDD